MKSARKGSRRCSTGSRRAAAAAAALAVVDGEAAAPRLRIPACLWKCCVATPSNELSMPFGLRMHCDDGASRLSLLPLAIDRSYHTHNAPNAQIGQPHFPIAANTD